MQPIRYSNQLRQLRAYEKRFNRDYTDQAQVVFNLRLDTIENSDIPDDQKVIELERAAQQYTSFMGRSPVEDRDKLAAAPVPAGNGRQPGELASNGQ